MSKPQAPSQDFSLKEGEKIRIELNGIPNKAPQVAKASVGGGLKKLAPPPGMKKSAPKQAAAQVADLLETTTTPA